MQIMWSNLEKPDIYRKGQLCKNHKISLKMVVFFCIFLLTLM